VKDDVSEKDRHEIERMMHEDILETGRYPDIVYQCSNISASQTGEGQYSATLNGELTLARGHACAGGSGAGDGHRGCDTGFRGVSLLQTDYGLKAGFGGRRCAAGEG